MTDVDERTELNCIVALACGWERAEDGWYHVDTAGTEFLVEPPEYDSPEMLLPMFEVLRKTEGVLQCCLFFADKKEHVIGLYSGERLSDWSGETIPLALARAIRALKEEACRP